MRLLSQFGGLLLLTAFTAAAGVQVPILAYHRFGPTVADNMTVATRTFESQLETIRQGGYRVIRLQEVVDSILSGKSLPPRSVVITADVGHESIDKEMVPRLRRYVFTSTLFIYPSAGFSISNPTLTGTRTFRWKNGASRRLLTKTSLMGGSGTRRP